jgi:hypothetical protein
MHIETALAFKGITVGAWHIMRKPAFININNWFLHVGILGYFLLKGLSFFFFGFWMF